MIGARNWAQAMCWLVSLSHAVEWEQLVFYFIRNEVAETSDKALTAGAFCGFDLPIKLLLTTCTAQLLSRQHEAIHAPRKF